MTKDELISLVVERTGLSRPEATRAVEAFAEAAFFERLGRLNDPSPGESMMSDPFLLFGSRDQLFGSSDIRRWEEAADGLRKDAEKLERGHEEFSDRLKRSRTALREIAEKP
jgi:hypothetical protein